MDVKNPNTYPARSTRFDLAASLSSPELMMRKTMTRSLFYETAKLHEAARIKMDTAAAFHRRTLAATTVQETQESEVAGIELVEDEWKAMKSEYVTGKSSQDTRNPVGTMLADLGVVTRAEGTEIVEFHIAKILDKIKAEGV